MIYSYLFEAKSIQHYLFRSSKIKDVIAASDRLDNLVDESESSLLFQVLNSLNLTSNLLDAKATDKQLMFTRCKGAGFYVMAKEYQHLVALRSCWSLTVQQLFPYLSFVDGLGQGLSADEAFSAARVQLAENRQAAMTVFPLANTIMQRVNRTGSPAIVSDVPDPFEGECDADTDMQRQAYVNWSLKSGGQLQQKFCHDELMASEVYFPVDFNSDYWFNLEGCGQAEETKNIALIHIDGNGVGNLMAALQRQIKNLCDDTYLEVMRSFSKMLAQSTQKAAQAATAALFQKAKYQVGDKTYVPLRPLVLGGDDLTVLCHARYALAFTQIFCQQFKHISRQALKDCGLYQRYLKANTDIKDHLTASGGVLFHKTTHPFLLCHNLVEELTLEAKALTKAKDERSLPAAVSFLRITSATPSPLAELRERFESFGGPDGLGMSLGMGCYFIDKALDPCLANITQLTQLVKKQEKGMTKAKWRQMAAHVAKGESTQAQALYQRAVKRAPMPERWFELLQRLSCGQMQQPSWYWQTLERRQSVINDWLTLVAVDSEQGFDDE